MEKRKLKAKKLTIYRNSNDFSPRKILGKIVFEDDKFLIFHSGSGREYRINKQCDLFSIYDTNEDLKGDFS